MIIHDVPRSAPTSVSGRVEAGVRSPSLPIIWKRVGVGVVSCEWTAALQSQNENGIAAVDVRGGFTRTPMEPWSSSRPSKPGGERDAPAFCLGIAGFWVSRGRVAAARPFRSGCWICRLWRLPGAQESVCAARGFVKVAQRRGRWMEWDEARRDAAAGRYESRRAHARPKPGGFVVGEKAGVTQGP